MDTQQLEIGKPGRLECNFIGRPQSITWSKYGLSQLPNHVTASGNILEFSRVRAHDAGTYRCVASDGVGSTTATVKAETKGKLYYLKKQRWFVFIFRNLSKMMAIQIHV